GILYIPSTKSSTPSPKGGESATPLLAGRAKPAAGTTSARDDYTRPLREFLTADSVDKAATDDCPNDELVSLVQKAGYQLNSLIATVPDPIDSRFGYWFDLSLEAIQRAVETQGYVLDRYWFPWEQFRKAEPPKGATGAAAARERGPGDGGEKLRVYE